MNNLFVIDGYALMYKAYYAFGMNPYGNSRNLDVNIIYYFTYYILTLIYRKKEKNIVVIFDSVTSTWRREIHPFYKLSRRQHFDEIFSSLSQIQYILNLLNIPIYYEEGYASEDIIGTLVKKVEYKYDHVYLINEDLNL